MRRQLRLEYLEWPDDDAPPRRAIVTTELPEGTVIADSSLFCLTTRDMTDQLNRFLGKGFGCE